MKFKSPWPNLRELIPEGKKGTAEVVHFEMTEEHSTGTVVRMMATGFAGSFCPPGEYIKLIVNGKIMMSDTQMEKDSNRGVVNRAHGSVLLGGLGLGMVALAICGKKEVTDVTVIENNPDVIALIATRIEHKKLTIIEGVPYTWAPEKGRKFDIIYFDIWSTIDIGNLPMTARLHQRFKFKLNRENPRIWMSSWMVDYLRGERRKEDAWLNACGAHP